MLVRSSREIDDPKSRASAGRQRIGPYVVDALRSWEHRQKVERIAAGAKWQNVERGLVFTDPEGLDLSGRVVTRRLQRVCRRLELPAYDWKSLRHAYATGILEETGDIVLTSKAMRHGSPTITGEVYVHYTRTMAERVAEDRRGSSHRAMTRRRVLAWEQLTPDEQRIISALWDLDEAPDVPRGTAELLYRTRIARGLPPTIEDPETLHRVARVVARSPASSPR